jgi:hypothetical protein
LAKAFETYTNKTPVQTTVTYDEAIKVINEQVEKLNISSQNKDKLFDFILATLSIESGSGTAFKGYEHNYAGVTLDINPWGDSQTYFNKKYFCADKGQKKNVPYASFDSFDKLVEFFISKFKAKVIAIMNYKYDDGSYKEKLAKANVLLWVSNLEEKVWTELVDTDKKKLEQKVEDVMGYFISKFKNN